MLPMRTIRDILFPFHNKDFPVRSFKDDYDDVIAVLLNDPFSSKYVIIDDGYIYTVQNQKQKRKSSLFFTADWREIKKKKNDFDDERFSV